MIQCCLGGTAERAARHACVQKWDAAEGLLYACRKLLSQPYVSPVYAMLLYQWLLVQKDAGGAEQRQKHVNLLVAGALPNCSFCTIRPSWEPGLLSTCAHACVWG